MPDEREPNLGMLFRSAANDPKGELDADAIVRKSRRRRLPQQFAVGAASVLVIVGVVGGGAFGLSQLAATTGATSSAASIEVPKPAQLNVAPKAGGLCESAERIAGYYTLCGCPSPTLPPQDPSLLATVKFSPQKQNDLTPGTVTITNNGSKTIDAVAGTPMSVLIEGPVIVSSISSDDAAGHSIHLAPGQAMTLDTQLPLDGCAAGSAKLTPGTYKVAVIVELSLTGGGSVYATGPESQVTITK